MADVDLLIVGGGAAGMAAALAAEKAGLCRILLADREPVLGGVLPQCVHRGFGQGYFGEDLTGPEYAERFAKRLAASAVEYLPDTTVLSVAENRTAVLSGAVCGYRAVSFRHLILATGCRETPIGALPVAGTRPAGVFTAGQAQALVNLRRYDVGSEIVILGSGDIGLIMARQFTLLGKHVIAVIEQEAVCGGMPRNIRDCIEAFRIPVITSATVSEVHGNGRLTGVTVRDADSGRETFIACDTLVTAVGLIPERELLKSFGNAIPEWISLCGNCDYVHEIVDAVTFQAERLGADAAKSG
jgi:NADPH-dependent 2,4-dienoyl-CoA reductase/sulfur reductase-like enzyme